MTKYDYVKRVVEDFLSISSYDENIDRINYMYAAFSPYIQDYVKLQNIKIVSSSVDIKEGTYASVRFLTVDVFRRMYYKQYCDERSYDASSDKHLRECIKDFMQLHCRIYTSDNTFVDGFDRRLDIVHFNKSSIDFISNRLFEWYKLKTFVDSDAFVNYLKKMGVITDVFNIFYSSIEKDKPDTRISAANYGISEKVTKIKSAFSSKYKYQSMANCLSAYLTSWFYNGNNCLSVYFCVERSGRLGAFSKFVERYYPSAIPTDAEYKKISCVNFNSNSSSFDINGSSIAYDNPQSGTDYFYTNGTKNELYYASNSNNYGAFGTSTSDVAKYYGFIKTSINDNGKEYFISDSLDSVRTFCFMAMSADNARYLQFLDYMKERYESKSILTETVDGKTVACSAFIDNVYDILKNNKLLT